MYRTPLRGVSSINFRLLSRPARDHQSGGNASLLSSAVRQAQVHAPTHRHYLCYCLGSCKALA